MSFSAQILTYATVRALVGKPHQRIRIFAKHDPLRNVPRGDFSLADYSYVEADLCQNEFGNCALRNLGAKA